MSMLTKALLTNFSAKRIFACNYIWKETRLSYAQYHTLSNSAKTQLRDFKCNKPVSREIAILSNMKLICVNFPKKMNDLYYKIINLFLFRENPRLLGFLWYETLDEVNIEEFFTLLEMPDTFFSRFKIIQLHVWMLLSVLPQETRNCNIIRFSCIRAMWKDQEIRAKMVDKYNLNFKKNMRDMYEIFKLSLLLYDIGYFENDTSLADALWFSFFSKENVDPRYLEVMVKFIRHQMHHLNSLNIKELQHQENKKGLWLPLRPHYDEIFNRA